MSPDLLAGSIGVPSSLNRYAYVGNDPINLVDLLGLAENGNPDCPMGQVVIGYDEFNRAVCGPAGGDFGRGQHDPLLDGMGGGGGGGGTFGLPSVPTKIYEDCAKKAFGGSTGSIPGIDRSIPSADAAALVLDASLMVGVDPAVVGATMAIEHNSELVPRNSAENSNGSIDVGPMQLNTNIAGQPRGYPIFGDAMGTSVGPNEVFNGDPFANIVTGANYLRMLGKHPERYVGVDPRRKRMLGSLTPKMKKFFDCIQKGLGLKK